MSSKFLQGFIFQIEFLIIFKRVHDGLFKDECIFMLFALLFHWICITFILEFEAIRIVFQLSISFEIISTFFICFLFQEGLFYATIWR